jgi:hypothetical protein
MAVKLHEAVVVRGEESSKNQKLMATLQSAKHNLQ